MAVSQVGVDYGPSQVINWGDPLEVREMALLDIAERDDKVDQWIDVIFDDHVTVYRRVPLSDDLAYGDEQGETRWNGVTFGVPLVGQPVPT